MRDLSASASVSDLAGNSRSYTVGGINIDRTPPTVTATATSDGDTYAGGTWTNHQVLVIFSCDDEPSGVSSLTDPVTLSIEGADQSASGTCLDKAGNSDDVTFSSINIDLTNPTIVLVNRTPANTHGWNNGDVTVDWACSDSLSGPVDASISRTLSDEGASQSTTGTCTDLAGNTASDTQEGINIDLTKPTLSPSVSPNPVVLGGSAVATPGAFDALSGLDTESCGPVDTSSPGLGFCQLHRDGQGGESEHEERGVPGQLRVRRLLPPGRQPAYVEQGEGGSGYPGEVQPRRRPGVQPLQGGIPESHFDRLSGWRDTVDTIEVYADTAGGSSLSYDVLTGQYNFVWKTEKAWAGRCFRFEPGLKDGTSHTFEVQFVKL